MQELLKPIGPGDFGILAQGPIAANPALYLVGAIAIMVLLTVALTVVLLAWKSPQTVETLIQETRSETVLRVATVLAIVLSATFIALSESEQDNSAVIALLSGISGYVLGGLRKPAPPKGPQPTQQSEATEPS